MPTDREWREAYEYLLSRLREVESDSSLLLEVQRATAVRVEADLAQEDLFQFPESKLRRVVRDELDLAKYRAPTPREAFVSAVGVLITRLREVPAVAGRLGELLEKDLESLQWRSDAAVDEFAPKQESFSARDLALGQDEKVEIEAALRKLEELLSMRRNDDHAGRP